MGLGLALILVAGREFGVADNGDFDRYLPWLASAPVDAATGWAAGRDNPAYVSRYFHQPLWYWGPPSPEAPGPTELIPSSGYLFWMSGKWLNDLFYSGDLLSLRYLGLPFFLLHALAFLYLLSHGGRGWAAPATLAGGFLLFTDARLLAFYNSLYAVAVPTLALFFLAAYFLPRIFLAPLPARQAGVERGFLALVLFLCLMAALAAPKHLNFFIPLLIVLHFAHGRRLRLAAAVILAGALLAGGFLHQGGGRVNAYNALYQGMLLHAEDPEALLRDLGLPAESAALIGENAYTSAARAFRAERRLDMDVTLHALALDPSAFAAVLLANAAELGNFALPYGYVYGAPLRGPPLPLTLATSAATGIAAISLFGLAALLGLALLLHPLGLAAERRRASRCFTAILLALLASDLLLSAFDGHWEAARHLWIGSMSGLLLLVQALCCAAAWQSGRQQA